MLNESFKPQARGDVYHVSLLGLVYKKVTKDPGPWATFQINAESLF